MLIQLVFLPLEIAADYRRASQAYQALLAGQDTISAEWDRDGGDELYHLYAQACEEERFTLF